MGTSVNSTVSGRWPVITKTPGDWVATPNLTDYSRTAGEFSWSEARRALDGLPEGRGLNIAHETIDRHAVGELRDRVALRWISKDGTRLDFTYRQLRDETNRFANVLRSLGVGKGDPVAVLAGRIPELRWLRSENERRGMTERLLPAVAYLAERLERTATDDCPT